MSFISHCEFSALFLHGHDWLYTFKESLVCFLETLNVEMSHFSGSDEHRLIHFFFFFFFLVRLGYVKRGFGAVLLQVDLLAKIRFQFIITLGMINACNVFL